MNEVTLRLRRDPETGKHDIIVEMKSDADALPHEHEQAHRDAVEKLLGKGSVGKVIVERVAEPVPVTAAPQSSPTPERQAVKLGG